MKKWYISACEKDKDCKGYTFSLKSNNWIEKSLVEVYQSSEGRAELL